MQNRDFYKNKNCKMEKDGQKQKGLNKSSSDSDSEDSSDNENKNFDTLRDKKTIPTKDDHQSDSDDDSDSGQSSSGDENLALGKDLDNIEVDKYLKVKPKQLEAQDLHNKQVKASKNPKQPSQVSQDRKISDADKGNIKSNILPGSKGQSGESSQKIGKNVKKPSSDSEEDKEDLNRKTKLSPGKKSKKDDSKGQIPAPQPNISEESPKVMPDVTLKVENEGQNPMSGQSQPSLQALGPDLNSFTGQNPYPGQFPGQNISNPSQNFGYGGGEQTPNFNQQYDQNMWKGMPSPGMGYQMPMPQMNMAPNDQSDGTSLPNSQSMTPDQLQLQYFQYMKMWQFHQQQQFQQQYQQQQPVNQMNNQNWQNPGQYQVPPEPPQPVSDPESSKEKPSKNSPKAQKKKPVPQPDSDYESEKSEEERTPPSKPAKKAAKEIKKQSKKRKPPTPKESESESGEGEEGVGEGEGEEEGEEEEEEDEKPSIVTLKTKLPKDNGLILWTICLKKFLRIKLEEMLSTPIENIDNFIKINEGPKLSVDVNLDPYEENGISKVRVEELKKELGVKPQTIPISIAMNKIQFKYLEKEFEYSGSDSIFSNKKFGELPCELVTDDSSKMKLA